MSSYAIRYNHPLFLAFDKLLVMLGRGSSADHATETAAGKHNHVPLVIGTNAEEFASLLGNVR